MRRRLRKNETKNVKAPRKCRNKADVFLQWCKWKVFSVAKAFFLFLQTA